jgi:hypothetical protein
VIKLAADRRTQLRPGALFIDDGRICLTNNAAERALRGFATLESLCIPSSSVCKHWNRVVVIDATRAPFSGHRRFDRLRRQVVGANLVRRAGHHLRRGRAQHPECVNCRMGLHEPSHPRVEAVRRRREKSSATGSKPLASVLSKGRQQRSHRPTDPNRSPWTADGGG